ncbi:MAG: hypothetical protein Q7T63_14205 [Burkholderiaceae bacterium]|nr:hypothetical protein [Burkholderiaceae bacterium]
MIGPTLFPFARTGAASYPLLWKAPSVSAYLKVGVPAIMPPPLEATRGPQLRLPHVHSPVLIGSSFLAPPRPLHLQALGLLKPLRLRYARRRVQSRNDLLELAQALALTPDPENLAASTILERALKNLDLLSAMTANLAKP